jgi:hypothetical protein
MPIVIRGATEGATPFRYVLMGIGFYQPVVCQVKCPACGETADLSLKLERLTEAARAFGGSLNYTAERCGGCPSCGKVVQVVTRTQGGWIASVEPILKGI